MTLHLLSSQVKRAKEANKLAANGVLKRVKLDVDSITDAEIVQCILQLDSTA